VDCTMCICIPFKQYVLPPYKEVESCSVAYLSPVLLYYSRAEKHEGMIRWEEGETRKRIDLAWVSHLLRVSLLT